MQSTVGAVIGYSDAAYIINLRDRPDRRRGVIREFKRAGVALPHPKVSFFTADRPVDTGGFPSIGARGSFTSHREVLRLAQARGLSNVLVFEDDVMFYRTPGLEPGGLIRALSAEPWDVAYFGYCVPPSDPSRSCVSSFAGKTIGGHFYAVRQPFLARMIDYMDASEKRPRNHPLGGPTFRDGAYNNIRLSDPSIRTVIVSPNMALQRSSRTDIGSPARLDLLPLARGPMAMMRGVKNAVRRAFQSDF